MSELAASSHGSRRPVLITGAGGRIGSYAARQLHTRYDLRLMIQTPEQGDALDGYGDLVVGDLGDLARLKDLCQGIDTVIHLAANADASATWSALLPTNIIGTYHMYVAAKAAGCRRLIFASSIHAVSGYPAERQVRVDDAPNPGDLYGVSKAFGEAMGRYMAAQEGLSVIAIRIGAVHPLEAVTPDAHSAQYLDLYVSPNDLTQLIARCIEVDDVSFAIVHGVSENAVQRLDLSETRDLVGYTPHDDFWSVHPATRALHLRQHLSTSSLADSGQRSGLRDDLH